MEGIVALVVQHPGHPSTLGCGPDRGLGNLSGNDRAALISMDYPNRSRMKLYARVGTRGLAADPEPAARLATPGCKGKVERGCLLPLEHLDWNCPQHVVPRFAGREIAAAPQPMRARARCAGGG